jgi:hypothetical protein
VHDRRRISANFGPFNGDSLPKRSASSYADRVHVATYVRTYLFLHATSESVYPYQMKMRPKKRHISVQIRTSTILILHVCFVSSRNHMNRASGHETSTWCIHVHIRIACSRYLLIYGQSGLPPGASGL